MPNTQADTQSRRALKVARWRFVHPEEVHVKTQVACPWLLSFRGLSEAQRGSLCASDSAVAAASTLDSLIILAFGASASRPAQVQIELAC